MSGPLVIWIQAARNLSVIIPFSLASPETIINIMTQMKTDIVVSGGGIAGLGLGILLAGAGLDVHLIDAAPPSTKSPPSGRTVSLMENSLNILKAANIWDAVKDHAAPLEIMRIIDDNSVAGRTEVDFHADDIGLKQFGYNIPNNILRDALYDAAKKTKRLSLHMPDALAAYEVHGAGVCRRA